MAKAFLSHSSENKDLVEKIAIQLGRNNCFYDKMTFEAGNLTIEEIFSSINETDIFVLFISEPALESKWVKKEISQARKNLNNGWIERIFPIIIDKTIKYSDSRIPQWIKKPYNLRVLDNEVLILKKITQLLREVVFKKNKHIQELETLFVGRNDLTQEFETKIINIDNRKPTCIIAYNFFPGMGRRTFLKNALRKTNLIDRLYEPVILPIESKESVEDFIYKLNIINPDYSVTEPDFSELDIDSKILIAKDLVKNFSDNNEIIFIIDEGSIVLPNTKIVDWFQRLIEFSDFENQITFCLISKFRPDGVKVARSNKLLAFRIDELSKPDTQTLFLQYLRILNIEIPSDDKKFFIDYLVGIPGQIIFTANLISSSNIIEAKKHIDEISDYSDLMAVSIFELFKDDELTRQILIAMSKIDIISLDLLYEIFGNNEEVNNSIQKLFNLSVFNFMFSGYEYIKLNSAISDYITRSRIQLNQKYSSHFNGLIKKSLSQDLDKQLHTDYSDFLFTLQNMIQNGIKIPKKYFLPSYVLKAIVQKYYDRRYDIAQNLCIKLLENSRKFDAQIIRETRYWLCLAYARDNKNSTIDDKFFEEVSFFKEEHIDNKDYYFLLAFYFRNRGKMDSAEQYYLKVLDLGGDHSKTKRELVNVYLSQGNYPKALDLARENYERFKTNVFHIHAYFSCLVKKYTVNKHDIEVLKKLMVSVKNNYHNKAEDIYMTMEGEFEFYINHDLKTSVDKLEIALKTSKNKYYPYKSLKEIYVKQDMRAPLQKLNNKYPKDLENDDDL
jgi:hypothetical protein